jgi:hypothetical protein
MSTDTLNLIIFFIAVFAVLEMKLAGALWDSRHNVERDDEES